MNKISRATAPGKVILLGEHAVNRGQAAIAAAVGLYATCEVKVSHEFEFQSESHHQICSRAEVLEIGNRASSYAKEKNYEGIRGLAKADYFAPQKYILHSIFGAEMPEGFALKWSSEIPSSSGLGSGGSAYVAMVAALSPWIPKPPTLKQRADWARLGDVIAHGGIASALDTQTSLLGGIICFTGQGLARHLPVASGLTLVVAHTGIHAATSEVNSRVRVWLAENQEARIKYFQTIGALSAAAKAHLKIGNWPELGKLFTLNQLVLEKIGVSTPETGRLIEAALAAGALGAKISGSGGGGIIITLVEPDSSMQVQSALRNAGAQLVIAPTIGVSGTN